MRVLCKIEAKLFPKLFVARHQRDSAHWFKKKPLNVMEPAAIYMMVNDTLMWTATWLAVSTTVTMLFPFMRIIA